MIKERAVHGKIIHFIMFTADIIRCKMWCRKFNKTSVFGPERLGVSSVFYNTIMT